MNKKPEAINSIIGESTTIKGEISSQGPLHLNGLIEGEVLAEGEVFVGEKGKVKGNISGGKVVVSGRVEGNISARLGLEIAKGGEVQGEITTDKLLIEAGSSYLGKVNIGNLEAGEGAV
ncbi:polymer-forming cytoskeletal protein [Candidatus Saganbacteria bacterium]|nr:polymer-forming cytoskeletal protein [Candidatus Saganbacteria bacterium]